MALLPQEPESAQTDSRNGDDEAVDLETQYRFSLFVELRKEIDTSPTVAVGGRVL